MKFLLISISLLLMSCHAPQPNSLQENKAAFTYIQYKKGAVYNRYKNKKNRYTIKQDAAPKRPQHIRFQEPKPIRQALSRYGNPSDYRVGGKRYEVMHSAAGYKTRGIASWYGTKFHKQRASSGEAYNMYEMTAAHKTLPIPTYIRVKNLENGRIAVVKVNDRGPFHSNRIIDLSYAAALKLGIFPKGTALVEIETIMGPTSQGRYYLQAGAFSSSQLARQLKEKLTGLNATPVFIEHYQRHYLVKVGPFSDKMVANRLKAKLARHGVRDVFSIMT